MDAATIAQLLRSPGADRQWVSWGTVEPDSGNEKSVRFADEDGTPLAFGVTVEVKLHPSGITVPCRVGNQCAGVGEGEYHPFGPGDEVLVVIPNGNERVGCTIVARGNQTYDTFPASVAGMDATKNNFAFKRLKVSYVIESGTAITLSVPATGSKLTIDPQGQVWLNDGSGNAMMMTPDAVTLGQLDTSSGDLLAGVQVDVANKTTTLVANTTALVLDDQNSQFQTSGVLTISTAGNGGQNHATSAEALVNFVALVFDAFAVALNALGPSPLTGTTLGTLVQLFGATTPTNLVPVIPLAAATPLNPLLAAPLMLAMAIPAVPGIPGLGAAGLLI
jgi:hypothetical protein